MSRLVPSQALIAERESSERRIKSEKVLSIPLEIFDDYNTRKSCIWKIEDMLSSSSLTQLYSQNDS